jgi:GT2 family glycosyltransferase
VTARPDQPGPADDDQGAPLLSVLILNWNGRQDTIDCVHSVLAAGYEPLEVLVVDNGSADGSVEAFQAEWREEPRVRVQETGENLGYAGGNNAGFATLLEEGAGHVLVLNNDTLVDPGAFGPLVEALEGDPSLGMVGPKVLDMERPERLGGSFDRIRLWWFGATPTTSGQVDRGQYDDRRYLDLLMGCAMLVRGEVLRVLGGFDPEYFAYYEEVDFAVRMREEGWRIGFVPQSIIRHQGGASTAGLGPVVQYYKLRNFLLFMRKRGRWYHYLTHIPIAFAVSGQRLAAAVLRGDWARAHALIRALLWHAGVSRDWRPGQVRPPGTSASSHSPRRG